MLNGDKEFMNLNVLEILDGMLVHCRNNNNAMTILSEELEQSTLKRSHDQVTTNELCDVSVSDHDMVPLEMATSHAAYPGSGTAGKGFSVPSNPPKNITGDPIVVSGTSTNSGKT
ncbi:hypothetical protein OS493_025679 [Desmophyllum pertusum]|uniref:Uncharacterized protein n=1 Tax=Desmophyllum pertusum TaxID=174260 RepID=A0A9W9ZLA6_9CNID|nr:hypothetical protein OS493_025679 [Desmophyllum pertusum]